jgi:Flp pilus assembly protein TadD
MTKRIFPRRSHLTVLAMLLGFATLAAASADDRTAATPAPASGAAEREAAVSAERRSAAIALFNEGVAALQSGDVETANAGFLAANQMDPEFPEPYRALAATTAEAEDWAAAITWAEGLLRFEPANLEAMRTVYFGHLMTGDVNGARSSARRLLTADPASLPDILDHGKTFFANNDFAMARVLLELVTEVDTRQPDALFALGVSCNALGDREAARAAFVRYLEVAPPDHPDLATAREMLEFLK